MSSVSNKGETTTSWIARLGAMFVGGAIGGWIGSLFSPGDDAGMIERFFYNWVITPMMVVGGAVAGSMIMGNWWSREGENTVAGYAKSTKDWFGSWFKSDSETVATVAPPDKTTDVAALAEASETDRFSGLVDPDRRFSVADATVTRSQPLAVVTNSVDRDRGDISLIT